MPDDDVVDGMLTEDQTWWILIHQSRCSKLDPEKRDFRRAVLSMMIRPDAREDFFAKLDEIGLADCLGEDAETCISSG